jgi:hypothetical protein
MTKVKGILFVLILMVIVGCNLPQQSQEAQPTLEAQLTLTEEPEERVLNVDDYGANPFDDQPDSDSIQSALNDLKSGETLLFTSGEGDAGYTGYLIDRTLFIVMRATKHDVTLTSTDPEHPALLQATNQLLGFVIHLYSRKNFQHPGYLDNIVLRDLVIDAGREVRICAGSDEIANGEDDNYGSWILGECWGTDDPWCSPGGITLAGAVDWEDYDQEYTANPSRWTTGLLVENVTIRNVECGTALGFSGAEGTVRNSTIDTAGEHTHVPGCTPTDPDGELAFWSDGITFDGVNMTVENNTIINASDVAIVFFGGKDVRIVGNTVISEDGNYGAFAGIAVHPWGFGNINGMEVSGNTVTSTSDQNCGGIHAGINIGAHMWNKGCVGAAQSGTIGNAHHCKGRPAVPEGAHCEVGSPCQIWGYVPPGESISLKDNLVRGAHINYLVGGVDVQGSFEVSENISETPQETDWFAAAYGCEGRTWGPLDFVALNPEIENWLARMIYCEY